MPSFREHKKTLAEGLFELEAREVSLTLKQDYCHCIAYQKGTDFQTNRPKYCYTKNDELTEQFQQYKIAA